jgi:hypothetical protein
MDDKTRGDILAFLGGGVAEIGRVAATPAAALAGALDRFEQRNPVQTIGTKVVAGDLRNPKVPILTRQQFEGFFEMPDESAGEKGCLLGSKCTGYDIPGWNNLPDIVALAQRGGTGAAPLKEFRVADWPDPTDARYLAAGVNEPMPCLSCILQSQTTHVYEHMRARTEPAELIQAIRVCVGPGEFCAAECHPVEAFGKFTGCPYPTPIWDVTRFAWAEHDVPGPSGKRAFVRTFFRVGPPVQPRAAPGGPPESEEEEAPRPQWDAGLPLGTC